MHSGVVRDFVLSRVVLDCYLPTFAPNQRKPGESGNLEKFPQGEMLMIVLSADNRGEFSPSSDNLSAHATMRFLGFLANF